MNILEYMTENPDQVAAVVAAVTGVFIGWSKKFGGERWVLARKLAAKLGGKTKPILAALAVLILSMPAEARETFSPLGDFGSFRGDGSQAGDWIGDYLTPQLGAWVFAELNLIPQGCSGARYTFTLYQAPPLQSHQITNRPVFGFEPPERGSGVVDERGGQEFYFLSVMDPGDCASWPLGTVTFYTQADAEGVNGGPNLPDTIDPEYCLATLAFDPTGTEVTLSRFNAWTEPWLFEYISGTFRAELVTVAANHHGNHITRTWQGMDDCLVGACRRTAKATWMNTHVGAICSANAVWP